MAREASTTTLRPGADNHEPNDELPKQPKPTHARRETLQQRAEEDDDTERLALTRAEFQDMLKDPETLYNEIVELILKMREVRAHSENYREQLQEAKQAITRNENVLDRVLAQNREPTPLGTPSPEGTRRPGKLPDPPLFDGSSKDGPTFENWLIQVKNKLRGNADSYPTEDLKIIYAAGRVSGNALALISPRLEATSRHAYDTVDELYEHLYELYGDPNKERNARQAFKHLTMQKGQTFQEFYAMFLRYVADGNVSARDLKDELNDKLMWKLQEAVATYYNDPTVTTTQLARHCTTVDQQIRARFEKRDQTTKRPEDSDKASSKATPRSKTSTKPASDERTSAAPKKGPNPAEPKCYNCSEVGHISRDCLKPPTERTKQIRAAKIAQVATEKEVAEDPGKERP
jgi:hypothetical protein